MPTVKLCSFIRETGRRCGSPAMRGQDRCFYHERDRLRRQILATWRINGDAHLLASMALPPLDTPEEVQICINAVFLAIAENRIDPETRRTLIDMLRLASRNLRTAALIRHFAAKDALAAQKLDANVDTRSPHASTQSSHDQSGHPQSGHEFTRATADSTLVKGRDFSPADADPSQVVQSLPRGTRGGFSPANSEGSPKNSAEVSDSNEPLTSAHEETPPQAEDLDLLAQLRSREEDRKAVAASLGDRTYICWPPKPKPPMPDPSTAAPSSEQDSDHLRSG